MERPLSKTLLRVRHFPHYICIPTRTKVLDIYKDLIQQANAFIDPLCKKQLRSTIYETFLAFKYVTQSQQVEALVRQAEAKCEILKQANRGNATMVEEVMLETLRTIGIDEFATHKLHGYSRMDHNNILFRIKHLNTPSVVSYEKEKWNTVHSKDLFYAFRRLLIKNRVTQGLHNRKLQYEIPTRLTVFGTLANSFRMNNLIRKSYSAMLKDAPTPVQPFVMEYIDRQLANIESVFPHRKRRFYKRRLLKVQKYLFTVELVEEGKLNMILPPKRIQKSNDIYFKCV